MAKHRQRRERRHGRWIKWCEMVRRELSDEAAFVERFQAVLFSRNALDFGPDGKPIKADFFAAIKEWEKTDPQSARACLNLIEKVIHLQSARASLSLTERMIS